MTTLAEMTDFFTEIAPMAAGLNARLKFDLEGDGVILLNAAADPVSVSNEDAEADTTFYLTLQDLSDMLSRKLDGSLAFSMGRLRAEGDMINAVLVTQLFG
ncbi:MAG: SCP2 sterol-binding domain-containing protein [Pseudomonadota bacterium]